MNEAEKKLVAALRSGAFRQGQSYLRIGDNHCCLGVACDVLGAGSWSVRPIGRTYYYIDEGGQTAFHLSDAVQKTLDWRSHAGVLEFSDRNRLDVSLMELNDDGFTFAQIADVIEAGLVL